MAEAIYLQKSITAWPQTMLELEFALFLKQFYEFKIINGDSEDIEVFGVIPISIQSGQSAKKLDAEGVQRVGQLIHDIIMDEMENY